MRNFHLALILAAGLTLAAETVSADLIMGPGTKIVFPDGSTLDSAPGLGGFNNTAAGLHATVAGGANNSAGGDYSAIGGGSDNDAVADFPEDQYQTIAGGRANLSQGTGPAIAGGELNAALGSGYDNTVAGGYYNTAGHIMNNTSYATVGGGGLNEASGASSTVVGGYYNLASGGYSTVVGGYYNSATGQYSFAAGQNAVAQDDGAFVWADSTTQFGVNSAAANEFVARASGGFYFYTNAATDVGARLVSGSSTWQVISDRNAKENIEPVDTHYVLDRVLEIPIQTFTYKDGDPHIKYMGVMAQDFHAAFGLGSDDKHVTEYDMAGAALASVQGLNAKLAAALHARDAKIAELEARLADIESRLPQLSQNPAP